MSVGMKLLAKRAREQSITRMKEADKVTLGKLGKLHAVLYFVNVLWLVRGLIVVVGMYKPVNILVLTE